MRVTLVDADPRWRETFEEEANRLRAAASEHVLAIEHIGSTAVPDLAAKPIIDVLLVVGDEEALEACAGAFASIGLERHGQALFKRADPAVHVHVRARSSPDIARWIAFRDRLRESASDRALYLSVKRQLASREWRRAREYAEAKDEIIAEILARCE